MTKSDFKRAWIILWGIDISEPAPNKVLKVQDVFSLFHLWCLHKFTYRRLMVLSCWKKTNLAILPYFWKFLTDLVCIKMSTQRQGVGRATWLIIGVNHRGGRKNKSNCKIRALGHHEITKQAENRPLKAKWSENEPGCAKTDKIFW